MQQWDNIDNTQWGFHMRQMHRLLEQMILLFPPPFFAEILKTWRLDCVSLVISEIIKVVNDVIKSVEVITKNGQMIMNNSLCIH